MTLPLSLTGYPASVPIPGDVVEVNFGQGAAFGDLSPKKVLILAPSTSAGSIVQDTEVYGPVSDETEAIAKLGAGSPAHRMLRAFLAVNRSTQVYVLCPTRSAGTAALLTVTLATTATGPGTAKIEFCEETIEVAFATGDTPDDIGADLAAAFNQLTHLPAIAVNASGTITITAKDKGPGGNALRLRAAITSGVGTTITRTTETAFASGATAATYTAALATILAQKFDVIVPDSHSGSGADAVLSSLVAQVVAQALPTSGIRQKVFAGLALAAATAVTLSQTVNQPRCSFFNLEESPVEPWVNAAAMAGVAANVYFPNVSANLDGYGTGASDVFPLLKPRNAAAAFTTTEQTLMLTGGVTPIAVTPAGTPYVVRAITSKSLTGATPDYKTRDLHRVFVADAFASDLLASLAASPWSKITEDPANDVQPGPSFATPSRVKALVEQQITNYVDAEHFDPAKKADMNAQLAVGVDPLNNTRMNIRVPIYCANLLHQTATQVNESSPAALPECPA